MAGCWQVVSGGEPGGMLAGVGFGGEVVRVLPLAQLFWRGGGDRGG